MAQTLPIRPALPTAMNGNLNARSPGFIFASELCVDPVGQKYSPAGNIVRSRSLKYSALVRPHDQSR